MTPFPLEAERLTKTFGAFTAVDSVSFQAHPGEILGVLGPNGAGKTTLFKMITGLLRPTSGRVRVNGSDVTPGDRRTRASLGYMSQKFSLYPLLTGAENVDFIGRISGLPRGAARQKIAELDARLPAGLLRRRVGDVPAGYRQQIALFAALMTDPEILLLDEPTTGAGPALRKDIWNELRDQKALGRTILVATHHLAEAEPCDRVLIVDRGLLVLEGRPDALVRSRPGANLADVYREAVSHEPRN